MKKTEFNTIRRSFTLLFVRTLDLASLARQSFLWFEEQSPGSSYWRGPPKSRERRWDSEENIGSAKAGDFTEYQKNLESW
jgi:hypothetical protein